MTCAAGMPRNEPCQCARSGRAGGNAPPHVERRAVTLLPPHRTDTAPPRVIMRSARRRADAPLAPVCVAIHWH